MESGRDAHECKGGYHLAVAGGSELRIEDKPPRHKGTKTRIEEILLQSNFVTSCPGDLVVNLFQSQLLTQSR
jgi:hypothetical protein